MEVGLYRLTDAYPSFNLNESLLLRDFTAAVVTSLTMSDRNSTDNFWENKSLLEKYTLWQGVLIHICYVVIIKKLTTDSITHLCTRIRISAGVRRNTRAVDTFSIWTQTKLYFKAIGQCFLKKNYRKKNNKIDE